MSLSSQKKLAILDRRQRVADLALQGYQQAEIAGQLGVAQSTISADLRAIQKQWRQSALRDFDALRELELQKLFRVERESWEAYARSQKPAQSADVDADDPSRPRRKRIRNQYGDPRFLQLVQQCVASRRALLGLDLAVTPQENLHHVTLSYEQRRARVVDLLQTLGPAATGRIGAALGDLEPGQPGAVGGRALDAGSAPQVSGSGDPRLPDGPGAAAGGDDASPSRQE
jgi:hypothetical protein